MLTDPNSARPTGPSGRRRADHRDDDLVAGQWAARPVMEMIMEASKASRQKMLYLL
jgi:hypothetical protein